MALILKKDLYQLNCEIFFTIKRQRIYPSFFKRIKNDTIKIKMAKKTNKIL